jgi:thiamine kinase-like enzyme
MNASRIRDAFSSCILVFMKTLTASSLDRYRKKVYKVLEEQVFIIGEEEQQIIETRISNGRRYFYLVAKRKEGNKLVERFVKIPINNTRKLLLPFVRQIEFARYAKQHKIINTRGVITANIDPKKGVPFVIMETFPRTHAKIGFIEGNKGTEFLTAREAQKTMQELFKLHEIKISALPHSLRGVLVKERRSYNGFRKQLIRDLNKKVRPLDYKGKKVLFAHIIETRLGIRNIKGKVNSLYERLDSIITRSDNKGLCLAHGDVAPNNLYVFDTGEIELLDLEWVGVFSNKALAMMFDFGNLHSRSWKNKIYRTALEDVLLDYYTNQGKEEVGRAIIALSILTTHLHHSSYFENYEWDKQRTEEETVRRSVTEQEILKAWEWLETIDNS